MKNYNGFRAVSAIKVPSTVARNVTYSASRRAPLRVQAARVGGVEIPNAKYVEFSLQYIYGIGHTTAKAILVDTVRFFISLFLCYFVC